MQKSCNQPYLHECSLFVETILERCWLNCMVIFQQGRDPLRGTGTSLASMWQAFSGRFRDSGSFSGQWQSGGPRSAPTEDQQSCAAPQWQSVANFLVNAQETSVCMVVTTGQLEKINLVYQIGLAWYTRYGWNWKSTQLLAPMCQ